MKHKPIDDLRRQADVEPVAPRLDRRAKLLRWAELLEEAAPRRVRSLPEVEFMKQPDRDAARAPDSALTVAFADPTLRTAGLASDRFGDGCAFFELSEREAHGILCSCRLGHEPSATRVAALVRRAAGREASALTSSQLWLGAAVAMAAASTAAALLI